MVIHRIAIPRRFFHFGEKSNIIIVGASEVDRKHIWNFADLARLSRHAVRFAFTVTKSYESLRQTTPRLLCKRSRSILPKTTFVSHASTRSTISAISLASTALLAERLLRSAKSINTMSITSFIINWYDFLLPLGRVGLVNVLVFLGHSQPCHESLRKRMDDLVSSSGSSSTAKIQSSKATDIVYLTESNAPWSPISLLARKRKRAGSAVEASVKVLQGELSKTSMLIVRASIFTSLMNSL